MIYLFGLTHDCQCYNGKNDEQAESLKIEVNRLLKDNKITILAEEYNQDALKETNGKQTVLQTIKDDNPILKHIFCEMSASMRCDNQIPTRNFIIQKRWLNDQDISDDAVREEMRKYYPIREKYWLSKILKHKDEQILFLCGADHIESFSKLLFDNKIENKTLVEDF